MTDLKKLLSSKFVNVDDLATILEIAFVSEKNLFIYGKGGHGKSECIAEFLKYIDPTGTKSFVQACGEGLTEEKLFGGMNLQKFKDTGEIEYLVENSFMNKEYVVFEEMLDCRLNVLLSLKDILTSKVFRQGSQTFPIKTKLVICLTNRSKQEVSEDDSIKALMERFPLEYKMEWESYNSEDYQNLFNKILKKDYEEVANICQDINKSGSFVSPRTAIHMAQVFALNSDLENLRFFGFDSSIIEEVRRQSIIQKEKEFLKTNYENFKKLNGKFSDLNDVRIEIAKCKMILNEIDKSYESEVFSFYSDLKDKCNKFIEDYKRTMLDKILS
jgi:hypothetical protein